MSLIRRKRKAGQFLIRQFPKCHRVCLLVFGIDGFEDLQWQSCWFLFVVAVRLGGKQCVLLLLVINNQGTICMGRQKQIFGTRKPFYMGNWGIVDYAVLVDPSVLLRHGFVPDNVARRRAHDNIQMGSSLGKLIDIVAKHVSFGEQHFSEMLLLRG